MEARASASSSWMREIWERCEKKIPRLGVIMTSTSRTAAPMTTARSVRPNRRGSSSLGAWFRGGSVRAVRS